MVVITRGIEIPSVPNYIRIEDSQETIDIAELSNEELSSLGQSWTELLIEKAEYRRKKMENC